MGFYTVWVRSLSYRGREPLTYSSSQKLVPGSIVLVPLQRESILGFVEAEVPKPSFAAKPIGKAYELPPLPPELIELAAWLRDFYGTSLGAATTLVLPPALTAKAVSEIENVVVKNTIKSNLTSLTEEQSVVVKNITKPDTYLLHGKTGSGKTRVYIELAQRALADGRSAIVLTPEIGLTSQLARSFSEVFGDQVVVLHSQLTPAQRQRAWLRILASGQGPAASVSSEHSTGELRSARGVSSSAETEAGSPQRTPLVVIGPRSALFSPLANLGLIVIDEAHEPAYKQEQAPYYHARAVASKLAALHSATLLIGSATPSISDYYLAKERGKKILEMKKLALTSGRGAGPAISAELQAPRAGRRPPVEPSEEIAGLAEPTKVRIVDLKDRGQFSRSRQLSQPLVEAVQAALGRGEQSLVYLNRRGTARIVMCENCGWQAVCPHCDLPLIYHADSGRFQCHTCGFSEPMRASCPVCGHPSILFKSFGTKAVTEEVQKLFPGARVQRFDTDNTRAERLEAHYESVRSGGVDILVGTQLLAKGLDLPRLSVIGFVQADSSLSVPDFSAVERTYQLVSQALGRVGRGHVAGHAVIQTYHPDSLLLKAAIEDDYQSFYNNELAERKTFHFPPFYHLLKLSCRRASYKAAEAAAQKLKDEILAKVGGAEVDGPAPSFHEKLQGKYQCQLVVRSKQRSKLLEALKLLPSSGWTYDIDPVDLM